MGPRRILLWRWVMHCVAPAENLGAVSSPAKSTAKTASCGNVVIAALWRLMNALDISTPVMTAIHTVCLCTSRAYIRHTMSLLRPACALRIFSTNPSHNCVSCLRAFIVCPEVLQHLMDFSHQVKADVGDAKRGGVDSTAFPEVYPNKKDICDYDQCPGPSVCPLGAAHARTGFEHCERRLHTVLHHQIYVISCFSTVCTGFGCTQCAAEKLTRELDLVRT